MRRLSQQCQGSITTIDQQLVTWLGNKEAHALIGTVHSIFNTVINVLSSDRNNLLTLALDEVVSSPWMMKTEDNYLFELMKSKIAPGDSVTLSENFTIEIKQIEWNYKNAVYSVTKINKKNPSEKIFNNGFSNKIYQFIKEQGKDSGLVSAWDKYSIEKPNINEDENVYVKSYLQAIKKMSEATENNDKSAVLKHSYRLIGLGLGLTPTGDDFILGCLAVWRFFESPLIEQFKESDWIGNVKKKTTVISAFMLENGVNGYVNQALGDLLMHHKEKDLSTYLAPFLKIGATSGTDMLIGVIFAYKQMN